MQATRSLMIEQNKMQKNVHTVLAKQVAHNSSPCFKPIAFWTLRFYHHTSILLVIEVLYQAGSAGCKTP
jgi:hypothetical protein